MIFSNLEEIRKSVLIQKQIEFENVENTFLKIRLTICSLKFLEYTIKFLSALILTQVKFVGIDLMSHERKLRVI